MLLLMHLTHWFPFSPLVASETSEAAKQSTLPSENSLYTVSPEIVDCLNVDVILPYLLKHSLLTQSQLELMLLNTIPRNEKVQQLIKWLPGKGPDFLEAFITCLIDSAEGQVTHRHHYLGNKLRAKKVKAEKELEDEAENELPELMIHNTRHQSISKWPIF